MRSQSELRRCKMDRTSVASSRRAEVTAPTVSGASANAQSSQSIPDILAPKTTAEATRGLRRQRDGSGNSASPTVASGNGAASSTVVQFQLPQANRKVERKSSGQSTRYLLACRLSSRLQHACHRQVYFCFHFGPRSDRQRPSLEKCEMQAATLRPFEEV
jgi:hypothetical protein